MGCYFLLQGIFLAQGLNLHLLHLLCLAGRIFTPVPPGTPNFSSLCCVYFVVCTLCCVLVSSPLRPYALYNTRLLCPGGFLGKNTGVGCHFLLQGIFLIQGSTKCDKNRSINYNIHNLWRRLSAINRCTLNNTETKHIKIILDTQVKLDYKYLYRID